MLKIENTEVMGWEAAIRGMRNPMNSWDKSDSVKCYANANCPGICKNNVSGICIGFNDLDLMSRLRNSGTDHRKFMRMITVYLDITAPLYWWKEFDTYKVGTVANSCSTMHKIHEKEFTFEDFSCEHLVFAGRCNLKNTIGLLNSAREIYLEWDSMDEERRGCVDQNIHEKKDLWWQMIQLLPSSYNQKRTVMLNYEVLANIYKSRRNHKLDEWHTFCDWIESLPYSELIIGKTDGAK